MDTSAQDTILKSLQKAEKSKTDITRATGVPYGPLGHALDTLIQEGKVFRNGLRYHITLSGERYVREKGL